MKAFNSVEERTELPFLRALTTVEVPRSRPAGSPGESLERLGRDRLPLPREAGFLGNLLSAMKTFFGIRQKRGLERETLGGLPPARNSCEP